MAIFNKNVTRLYQFINELPKMFFLYGRIVGTVVDDSTHDPKIKGLNHATGTGRGNMAKKKILKKIHFAKTFLFKLA